MSLGSELKPESAAKPVVGPEPDELLEFSGDLRMTTGGGLEPGPRLNPAPPRVWVGVHSSSSATAVVAGACDGGAL